MKILPKNYYFALNTPKFGYVQVQLHRLLGRYTSTPLEERFCKYCHSEPQSLDTEFHFLFECSTFSWKRQCFFGKLASLGIIIEDTWPDHVKLAKVLCPTSAQAAKCISKFISIMEKNRSLIDEGTPPNYIGHINPFVVGDLNDQFV